MPAVGDASERSRWTLVAVCATTFMLLVDITIVNVALPNIQHQLHASLTGLQWVVDAYAITLAALILTAGALADRYGRKLLFSVGVTVFSIASLLGGILTDSLGWRWVFFVNVPVGAFALTISVRKLRESRDEGARRTDVLGLVSFSVALFLIVLSLLRGNDAGWTSAQILGSLLGG